MKRFYKTFAFVVAAGMIAGIFGAGFVVGQQADNTFELVRDFDNASHRTRMNALEPANEEYKDAPAHLSKAYAGVVRNHEAARAVLAGKISQFYTNKRGARTAEQTSQVANETTAEMSFLIAAQNQRIIELLEQQAKDKKAP